MIEVFIYVQNAYAKHLRKILMLKNEKMNQCYFIDEKLIHIKVSLHIITFHPQCSPRQRFQRHCRLDPDHPRILTSGPY